MKLPRILLAAPASGSGKTLITCGILQVLKNRGLRPASFKCGPDYIDPMFHTKVLGISSGNLDTFFTEPEICRALFAKEAKKADFSIIEGVMGYYDGLGGISEKASAYEVAKTLQTPTVLIVDTKGMSLSIVALVKGFLEYQPDSRICGVILNRMSAGLYPRIKEQLESQLPIKALGYVPEVKDCVLESRHLGLITPDEIENLQERLDGFAKILEKTLDISALLKLGEKTEPIEAELPEFPKLSEKVRIGVAKDEAFCFHYRDNLELLQRLGAELVYFSPLRDEKLPKGLDGLIFYGGYPELYAEELSRNDKMRAAVAGALCQGMPYLAECGGFLYLHESLEDLEGSRYPMVGFLEGHGYRTKKLGRFGYINLNAEKDTVFGKEGTQCKGHEFHYYDSTNNGEDFRAEKPMSTRGWKCIHGTENGIAGFPHFYYYSNPRIALNFLKKCEKMKKGRKNQ